ncbi:MAG: glycerol acyltransferase [Bacteroidetes bacterium]|nr:MAG: glycerol acyltransferase [Bacteroidota bacterium]
MALRKYTDTELQAAVREVFSNKNMLAGMRSFLPADLYEQLLTAKDQVKNSTDFQHQMMLPFLQFVARISINGLTASGLDRLDPAERYLFICNHRDIGLDSAFLNKALAENGFTTTQIAIGDNLMTHRLAELIFRINKSFAVLRSGSPRQVYQHSLAMSAHIHRVITSCEDSVWIAQREGRAKDGNDCTQIGVLKMLSLCHAQGVVPHFRDLNVVPVAISYEYDPTGLVKTQDFLRKQLDPDYKKRPEEDLEHILLGIRGQKGRVHLHFSAPLTTELDTVAAGDGPKKQLEALALLIDRHIHRGYRLHPVNYIAHDLLTGNAHYQHLYTSADLAREQLFFDQQLNQLPADQYPAGRQYLLGMYANPVRNAGQ